MGIVTARLCSRAAAIAWGMSLGWAVDMAAQQPARHDHAPGKVEFAVSCSAPAAAEFERGLTLLHHMTYPQAREAFERSARLDSRCAMAHWGIAMTLFQPLWPTRPGPEQLRRGWQAARIAASLRPPTERERLFVETAVAFFRPDSAPYWQRIRRWEQAAARAYAALPQDAEATAFYALAHLAAAPSNDSALAYSERAARLLLAVYQKNPAHPGAMHYLIHANDAAGREHESPEIVRQYETSAPQNPHALHMPTHIYTRLGEWDAVIRGNLRAADAALAHPAGDAGQFVWDEFPHAIEYVVYGYLQKGADDSASAQVRRLHETARLEPTFKTAFHLASTRAREALERRAWAEASALPVREPATLDWDAFTWPEAVTWFARGLGSAHQGNLEQAHGAVRRLAELEGAAGTSGEPLFARHIRILRLGVEAWLAHASGRADSSVALMGAAVELEESTPKHAVTPAPTLPAAELLGDLLLDQKRAREALDAYQRSLRGYPGRLNSLLGAARAAKALGDATLARAMYEQVLVGAGHGTRADVVSEARAFLR
jgi:tetratricopeptide (TPR) repeat protein